MSFNYALLAELAERERKMQLKEINCYDDAIVTRNRKFVTAKVLDPLPAICSSKFRSVGINTNQELLTCPSLQKESRKKKMINLTSEDESTELLEITDKPSYHSRLDNMSSSSEETIFVDEDTNINNLMTNPFGVFRPGFGIESIVHRRKISYHQSYSLFRDGQFIMKAHTQIKNGARSYLLSTTKDLKPNEKADILFREVRGTSDTNFLLYSLCEKQENRELVANMKDKLKSEI